MEKELVNKLKYLINKKKSLQEICNELELKDYEVIGMVELLKQDGFLADYIDGEIVKLKKPIKTDDIYQIPANSENLKLCLISDTHLCSKYDRLDILNYIYDKAYDKLRNDNALNEYAVDSTGHFIGMDQEGEFARFTAKQVADGEVGAYTLLTNSNLLDIRARYPNAAFNSNLIMEAANGISMEKITEHISKTI